jgi:hypothetical protein
MSRRTRRLWSRVFVFMAEAAVVVTITYVVARELVRRLP